MGDYTRFDSDSDISINPPLTWGEIKDSAFLEHHRRDCHLLVEEIRKETDTGTFIEKTASYIVVSKDSSGRTYGKLGAEIEEIVKQYPTHRFDGLVKGVTEGFDTDDALWGILVENNKVSHVKPKIVWPGQDG